MQKSLDGLNSTTEGLEEIISEPDDETKYINQYEQNRRNRVKNKQNLGSILNYNKWCKIYINQISGKEKEGETKNIAENVCFFQNNAFYNLAKENITYKFKL